LYDIYVPRDRYEAEIVKLKQQIDQLDESKEPSPVASSLLSPLSSLYLLIIAKKKKAIPTHPSTSLHFAPLPSLPSLLPIFTI
jgi:hypothetical protein